MKVIYTLFAVLLLQGMYSFGLHPLSMLTANALYASAADVYDQPLALSLGYSHPHPSQAQRQTTRRILWHSRPQQKEISTSTSDHNALAHGHEPSSVSTSARTITAVENLLRRLMLEKGTMYTDGTRRRLGDFDELNEIFADAEIIFPDLEIPAGTVDFFVNNLKCSGISIQNLIVEHRLLSNKQLEFDLNVRGLSFNCDMEWGYKWGFIRGSGDGQIYTSGSSALIQVTFESEDFNSEPPRNAYVSDCKSDIKIDDIDLQGGLIAWIFNAIEGALRGTIQEEANEVICEGADAIGVALIDDWMLTFDEFIDPYKGTLPPELNDPLYPESQIILSDSNSSLFDFSTSPIFTTLMEFVDRQLGELVDDPDGPTGTGQDLGINKIIRSTLLNEDRQLVINGTNLPNGGVLHNGEDIPSKSTLAIQAIRFKGLDTITKFDPLNTIGKYTISNHFSLAFVDIEVDAQVIIRPTDADGAVIDSGKVITENISIDFGIDDMDVDFALLVAVDVGAIGDIPLGAILTNLDQIGPCLGGAVNHVTVSFLSSTVGNIEAPKLEGFISPGIDRLISSTVVAIFEMYEGALIDIMPNIFQKTLRNLLNDGLSSGFFGQTSNSTQKCGIEAIGNSEYLNFPDFFLPKEKALAVGGTGTEPYGTLGQALYQAIKMTGSQTSDDGFSIINDLVIDSLTKRQSGVEGTVAFPQPLVDLEFVFELGLLALSVQLKISDSAIENLNTVRSPIVLLRPIAPQLLQNTAKMGASSEPISLKTELMFGLDAGGDERIENLLEISMEFDEMSMDAIAYLAFLEKALMEFPISDVGNIHCWLARIPPPVLDSFGMAVGNSSSLYLEELDISTSGARLNIECISCSSPLFEALVYVLKEWMAIADLTESINYVLDWVVGILSGSFAQIQIDRFLANSQKKCPHIDVYQRGLLETPKYENTRFSSEVEMKKDAFLTQFSATIGALIFCMVVIMAIVRWISKRRFVKWMESLSDEDRQILSERYRKEDIRQRQINAETTSMVTSSSIPLTVRIFTPLVVIGNILLFLIGHLSVGAGVNADVEIAGQTLPVGTVFEFILASSIRDMWRAGATELAIFVAIFSCVWPYTKQIITLIIWFSPTRFVSTSRRGSVLSWLDNLGKWSFVDIFVLVITLAAFRISIKSPEDVSFLPPDFYSVEVLVIPAWGLYANVIAQLLSHISSHFILHYHRKIIADYERQENNELVVGGFDGKRALRNHFYVRGDGAKRGRGFVVKRGVNVAIVVSSLIAVALLFVGCSVNAFNVENNGLVGLLVEAGQDLDPAITSYSVFKIVKLMFEQAMFTDVTRDYLGLGSLAVIIIFTVLIAPIAQLMLLLQRWFMPLGREGRKKNIVILECIQAWRYSEVFILSIVVTSWQLAPVSESFLNDSCGNYLGEFFGALVTYDVLDGVNAQCFRADPSIIFGTWILIAAVLVLALLNHFVSKAALHEMQDEIARYYGGCSVEETKEMDKEYVVTEEDVPISALANSKDDFTTPIPPARFMDYYRWLLRKDTARLEAQEV